MAVYYVCFTAKRGTRALTTGLNVGEQPSESVALKVARARLVALGSDPQHYRKPVISVDAGKA